MTAKSLVKDAVKQVMFALHLDVTRNQKYDRGAFNFMKSVLRPSSNCIDVGCHKGDILKNILKLSPRGTHYAFEPIPLLYELLENKFSKQCKILPYALSDFSGMAEFHYVVNAPAFSGIKNRDYYMKNPQIENIPVEVRKLDSIVPSDLKIDFIKLDVEGGEFQALKGAEKTIARSRPHMIFEFGLGSAEYYGAEPAPLFDFLAERKLKIKFLKENLETTPALSRDQFIDNHFGCGEYYFAASADF